ncbi:MAG TPA: biopolymer transporter ExbD [Synergistaceae bacterium]|nr:biopolymer transporter ExbD [Synergistaceae bacterium]
MTVRPRRSRGGEVDLTPLIDVLFILVLFLVLAGSMDRSSLAVNLPEGRGSQGSGPVPWTVSVLRDGSLVDDGGRGCDPEEALKGALEAERARRPVRIAGDRGAPYGAVAELLARFRAGGVTAVELVFEGGQD